MGRVKGDPKKKQLNDSETKFYDYIPVRKKRRIQKDSKCNFNNYRIANPNTINRQYYLGKISIGSTDNALPENYSCCKICFKNSENETEFDSLILNCDDSFIIIKTTRDVCFLRGKYLCIFNTKRTDKTNLFLINSCKL